MLYYAHVWTVLCSFAEDRTIRALCNIYLCICMYHVHTCAYTHIHSQVNDFLVYMYAYMHACTYIPLQMEREGQYIRMQCMDHIRTLNPMHARLEQILIAQENEVIFHPFVHKYVHI